MPTKSETGVCAKTGLAATNAAAWGAVVAAVVLLHVSANDVLVLVAFTAIVAAASLNRGSFDRVMSLRPIYWLGTISYSIYMTQALIIRAWQFAFGALFHHHMSTPLAFVVLLVLVAIILAFSAFTYQTIETTGRRYLNRVAERIALGQAARSARVGAPVG